VRDDGEVLSTPFDSHKRLPRERLSRSNGNAPRQPVLWAFSEVLGVPEPCYGRYPRGFLERVCRELNVNGRAILHVCSGAMTSAEALGGVRLDVRTSQAPDVVADGRALPFLDGSFRAVLLDPPYSTEYAESLYGVKYPRPSHLLAEASRVCAPGGAVCLLHYLVPVPPPNCDLESVRGVTQGLGYRIRAWTVFRKHAKGLPFDQAAALDLP